MCVNTRTRAVFFSALAILATGSISAQRNPQTSSGAQGLPHARIRCDSEPYVSLTADPERALPLEEVAKADCNERVTIVSDPGSYTVRVVTANGSVGYVARYELVFEPPKALALAQPAPAATGSSPSGAPTQVQAATPPTGQGPAKPRVYISDTQSWNETEGFSNPSSVAPDKLYGGYNPEMADVYQNFTSDCAGVSLKPKAVCSKRVIP